MSKTGVYTNGEIVISHFLPSASRKPSSISLVLPYAEEEPYLIKGGTMPWKEILAVAVVVLTTIAETLNKKS